MRTVSNSRSSSNLPTIGARLAVVSATVLLAFVLSSVTCARPSGVGSAGAEDYDELISKVSGQRMMDTVNDLQEFGSRAFCLNTSGQIAENLAQQFSGLGLYVYLDEFTVGNHSVANVVAAKNGTSNTASSILLGAHYDSENSDVYDYSTAVSLPAPGADDDASGVAAVLEIARVLSDRQMDRTVQFVLFTAEENGYDYSGGIAGSAHFASAERAKGTQYAATVILDMIGYRGASDNHVVGIVNNDRSELVDSIRAAITTYDVNLTLGVVKDDRASFSDQYSFWVAGYPSVLMVEAEQGVGGYLFNPYYHTASDRSDAISEEQLTEVTKAVLGGVLGMIELRGNDNTLAMILVASGTVLVTASAACLYLRKKRG